jgi:hypothetical protein
MVGMESKQKGKRPETESGRESISDSPDLHLDDLEDEIIDLVDVAEEGAPAADAVASDAGGAGDEFEFDDVEPERDAAGTIERPPHETSEQEMQEADEALGEAEEEFQSLLRDETDEPERVIDDLAMGAEQEAAEVGEASDLFPPEDANESDLLDDGPTPGEEREESLVKDASQSDEEFFEGLFDDLEIDEEGAKKVSEVPEEASMEEAPIKEEPAGDLLADLRLENEMRPEAEVPEPPAAVEEFPEDLFADLDTSEKTSPGPREAAAPPFPVSGESAEELMALVREHVEAVVTRVVEKRLPVIAERIIMEEIKKIKAAME